ncbi:MAG: MAPEG family protein, partial [Alphaproteobacteria bacterium]|nr:MAPEG family protein [Alphaproteobacteria bacterium]
MEASIASEVLTRYQKFSERDLQGDYVAGVMDGEREYPPSNQLSFSQYEEGRIAEARTTLNRYMRRLRETVDEIDRRIAQRISEGEAGYNSNKGSIASQKAYELESLRRLKGPASPRWMALEHAKASAERDFEQAKWALGRQPRMSMHLPLMRFAHAPFDRISIYTLLLLLLALLEVPINQRAIELTFRFSPLTSLLVAAFVGLGFVILAHFLGIAFLRMLHSRNGKRWRAFAFAITLLAMAGLIIVTLYFMRGELASVTSGAFRIENLLDTGVAVNVTVEPPPSSLLAKLMALLPWTETGGKNAQAYAQFGLLLLNSMVFFIGTILSYVRHDPDSEFESAWRRGFDATRAFEAYEEAYTTELTGMTRNFDARIAEEERRADRIRDEVSLLEQERERMKQQMANDIRLVMDVPAQQINAYQRGNEQVRRTQLP